MHDDTRFLAHLVGWLALTAAIAAILPPVDAYGIDDLGPQYVRSAPRPRQHVALAIAPAAEVPEAGPAPRAARPKREPAPLGRLAAKLIGTRGASSRADAIWDRDERSLGVEALDEVAATGPASRGVRGIQGGDDGPARGIAIPGVGGENVEVASVPVTVELATRDQDPADAVGTMSLRPYLGRLRYCYEKRLMHVPGLGGRVELSIGRDRAPRIVADTTGDPELGRCVLAEARRWELPDGLDEVALPVVFRAE